MANGFVPVDRGQRFLLPVDMGDWLEPDHVVWFLIDVVERLDLSELRSAYQLGGTGRRAYDPAMMLTLLLYGLSQGVRSSRAIERGCRSDAAFRVICGTWEQFPDHATICRFRRRHQEAIGGLFCQVLVLAQEVGMGRLGLVAIDGTKVGANASRGANRTEGWIRQEVARLLAEAETADQTEDAELGDVAGWEMPDGLGDRNERLERLERALNKFESQPHRPNSKGSPSSDDADSRPDPISSGDNADTSSEKSRGGRKERRVNVTDPDSKMMSVATGGFVQGYNCQVVTTEDGLVAAATVTDRPNDYGQLSVMLEATAQNLTQARIDERPEVVIADAGYFDTADIGGVENQPDDVKPLLLVATGKTHQQRTDMPSDPHEAYLQAQHERQATEEAERQRRAAVLTRWDNGDIDYRRAATEMGVSVSRAYANRKAWKERGPKAIPVPQRKTGVPLPPKSTRIRYLVESRLADPVNRDLYKKRAHLAETPFARIKEHQQLRRFARRGISAVNAEFLFDCLVHNLLRIRAHQPA